MTDTRIAVLVVEDEALVRMAIVDELEDAGFEVFEADNADKAIDILVATSRIQLMFTDVDMPGGTDGLKLAASSTGPLAAYQDHCDVRSSQG